MQGVLFIHEVLLKTCLSYVLILGLVVVSTHHIGKW